MCIAIMYHFTMESFGIIEESQRNIVPEVKRFVKNPLLKRSKRGTAKNQLSYCEQNNLRDYGCHGCGGYLCSKQRRLMRTKRGCNCRGVRVC